MATTTKPTILIIHGGWHTPASYEKLISALEASGYEVHCPRLLSANEVRPPNAGLADDTALVRSYAESLVRAGHRVVAIAHSYGGQVASNALYGLGTDARAAKGLKGGVSHLVYLCGYAVPEGIAMMDKVKEFNNMDLVPLAFDFADDGTAVSRDPKTLIIGPGPSDAEIEAYLKTWVRWHGNCMYQASEHAAWRDIPVAYIKTTADMTVPVHYQQHFIEEMEKAGRKVEVFEVAAGHCPNFTATDDVVNAVNKLVGV
ncbi:hypothetical protein KVR01_005860 [Diaporthe batatas]|uniref:uncharacterized protein n=1 Tax=Diaporthe batatas TaxID=748121 RepID=UPI001D0430BF|nr:uncharacterized protein KVR01_005860 [Diaporthe batatas]KAG8163942.1 hypothetical protein KVR01_005860 [Diaporthe batatas]